MPWYFPWPDYIKKKACRYLLQHYLGSFLEEKLSLDQLSVDLYSGTGTVKEVKLDVWALNELLDSLGAPVELRDGTVESISVEIPWSALLTANSKMTINGLALTLQPKYRRTSEANGSATSSMAESMWSTMSMTSSMQLAQECLKRDQSEPDVDVAASQPFEGPELLAQMIESVLTRVEMTLINTIVRLEHVPTGQQVGVALELHIDRLEYYDEGSKSERLHQGSSVDSCRVPQFEQAAVARKNFKLYGVTLHCGEFPEEQRLAPELSSTASSNAFPSLAHSPEMPPQHHSFDRGIPTRETTGGRAERGDVFGSELLLESCMIGKFVGKLEVKVKLRQQDRVAEPKADVETYLGSVSLYLSPRQVHILLEVFRGFLSPVTSEVPGSRHSQPNKLMRPADIQRIESALQDMSRERHRQDEEKIRRQSWGLEEEEQLPPHGNLHTMQSLNEEEDLFFSLTGSLMSMSHTGTMDDMETSFTSTVSSSSTDTSRTGSSMTRLGYGNTIYRGPSLTSFGTPIPKTTQPRRSRSNRGLREQLEDPSAELSHYKLCFSSLCLVVLHNDPTSQPSLSPAGRGASRPPTGREEAGRKRRLNMEERARYFFDVLGNQEHGKKDRGVRKERFAEACPYDHLRLTAAPVKLDSDRKTTANITAVTADLSLGTLELYECLFERPARSGGNGGRTADDGISCKHIEILYFEEEASADSDYVVATKPSLGVRFKSIQRTSTQGSQRRIVHRPRSEIVAEFGRLTCEFDVTTVDRLYKLLHCHPIGRNAASATAGPYRSFYGGVPSLNKQALFNQTLDDNPSGLDQHLDLRISCPIIRVAFRFPIPDLRDMSDCAWWKQSLRDEILHIELRESEFRTALGDGKPFQTLLLQCREIHGRLQLSADEPPVSFLRVNHGSVDLNPNDKSFDWPKLEVKLYPQNEASVFEDDGKRDSPPINSWEGACHFESTEPSPFSSRRVMYDSEQMVMPGDQEEMKEFSEKAVGSARVVLDLVIPSVNVLLPSKDFLELLYNRFGYDLLLWQPAAPIPRDYNDGLISQAVPQLDLASHLGSTSLQERFTVCQSAIYCDSDSDTEEESSGMYSYRHKTSSQERGHGGGGSSQSFLALNLTVNHGKVTMCTPLKENGSHSEVMVETEECSLFAVTDYGGNANLSYLCVQANRLAVYHNGSVDGPVVNDPLPSASATPPDHLRCCLYLSDSTVNTKLNANVGKGAGSEHMLALALKMYFNPATNIKSMKCSVGIKGTTLRHHMTKPENSWIVQLGDFFDIVDEEVLGYEMPSVVTEFHAHLWGCGVDYRPVHLPIRTYLMADTLSVSSNLVYEAKESLLRILVDDAALYLSDQCNERLVDLRRNYVCVLDLGMLELLLRMNKDNARNPKVDLKMSNNVVHLRTCADSCTALTRLILYLAGDGDQSPQQPNTKQNTEHQSDGQHEEPVDTMGQPLSDSPIGCGNHLDQMQKLMAEAMEDVRTGRSHSTKEGAPSSIPCTLNEDGDLFLFPNEDWTVNGPPTPTNDSDGDDGDDQRFVEGGVGAPTEPDDTDVGDENLVNDDEFCILDDPGMGVLRHRGEPEVNLLQDVPVSIKEEHFARPLGRGDQLNAPSGFPVPDVKYTLQEMSVVWHIFGGNDFGPAPTGKLSVPEMRSSNTAKPSTPERTRSAQSNPVGSPGSRKAKDSSSCQSYHHLSWQERGGPGRDHTTLMELQMNKVRFQHTEYPEGALQRSRQILLINDIEIRDRLANSQINKFLYLYSSEARPRRTHANMVLVKALHIRPDPNLEAEECRLRVSIQPLRLNIDQDSLYFLHKFFTKVSSGTPKAQTTEAKDHHLHCYAAATSKPPAVSKTTPAPGSVEQWLADGMDDDDNDESREEESSEGRTENGWTHTETYATPEPATTTYSIATDAGPKSSGPPIFFKSFVFSPDVPIKLDYEGKRVDMDMGTLMGVLIGLGQLNHSELTLKRLHNRHGLLGIDKLILYVFNEWAADIKKTQLPSLLGGVGPMHSFVQLVQGMVDLVRLPVEQYRKDGRLMRGFQRGANSFGTSTAMAAVELTNRVVRVLQTAAETAYDMVSPGPSVSQRAITYGPFGQSRLARQPTDFREGMANAFNVVREGLEDAALAIVQVAQEEHEHKGYSGAVGGILRQIPPTVIKPLILASEATSSVLGGMRNQMLPDARREDAEKWRSEQSK